MAGDEPLITLKFDSTLGALLCGFTGASVAYGIFCTQIWTYYHRYTHDGVYKFLVPAVWFLETIHHALIGHSVYYYTVTNYMNPSVLLVDKPIFTLTLQIIVSTAVGMTVKTVFAIRVWRISNHNYVITGLLLLLICTQLGLAIVFITRCFGISSFAEVSKVKLEAILSLGAGVATDVCTATALCYYLQKLRSDFARFNALVNSMQYHAVDTGILTSAFSLMTLILFNVYPDNFIFLGLYFMLSKFYATSFLAALNARKSSTTTNSRLETGHGSNVNVISSRDLPVTWNRHDFVLENPDDLQMNLRIGVHKDV